MVVFFQDIENEYCKEHASAFCSASLGEELKGSLCGSLFRSVRSLTFVKNTSARAVVEHHTAYSIEILSRIGSFVLLDTSAFTCSFGSENFSGSQVFAAHVHAVYPGATAFRIHRDLRSTCLLSESGLSGCGSLRANLVLPSGRTQRNQHSDCNNKT